MGKESGFLPRGHVTGQEAHGRVLGTRRHAAGRRARQRRGRSGGDSAGRRGDAGRRAGDSRASGPLWQTVWGFFKMFISATG